MEQQNAVQQQAEQSIAQLVAAKGELMKQGKVVEATEYYADDAEAIDFTGVVTKSKHEMVEKMKTFTGGIKNVNGITFHDSAVSGDISFMEFTFDFEMTDSSKVFYHEVIRSVWKDGKIVREQFFNA